MNRCIHDIWLESEQHFGGHVPAYHVGLLMVDLPTVVRGAVSMALRNRSQVRGPQPQWLKRASDLRFVEHSGNGATQLRFDLPTLESAAPEVFTQRRLLDMLPDGRQTGLDLVMHVVAEVVARNTDSEAFDAQLLQRLERLRRFFRGGGFTMFRIVGSQAAPRREISFTEETCETSAMLSGHTPPPQRVRLAGTLDAIEASTQRFALLLAPDERVPGVYPRELSDRMQQLWRKRVLVLGSAVYRASGNLLRIEADDIQRGEGAAELFSVVPVPRHTRFDASRLRVPQGPRSGMAAIMGRWPGDESDEEIEAALEQLS